MNPGNDEILYIGSVIKDIFDYYKSHRPHSELLFVPIWDAEVERALEAFARGEEQSGFSFTLSTRQGNELSYLSFSLGSDILEISRGGSIYEEGVGSDSFTLWSYTLYDSGETEGSLFLDSNNALWMIKSGAEIEFEYPYELTTEAIIDAYQHPQDECKEFLTALTFSYELLMAKLAEPIVKRIVGNIKRWLQSLDRNDGMMCSEEDSCLKNVWDEICVQVQGQQSIFYEAYLDMIERQIDIILNQCSVDELTILWTQTQEYEEWTSLSELDNLDRNILQSACSTYDVCRFLLHKVIEEAGNYNNIRIEKYLYSDY